MPQLRQLLASRIEGRGAQIGVVGLGYVGLPLALNFASKGFPTVGFDIDPTKIEKLNAGKSYIGHIPSDGLDELVAGGKLRATTDFAEITGMDAIVICVPTPLKDGTDPDLQFVTATAEAIAPHMRAGQLVVLESTTYPGTSREVLKPILESGGLASGQDFFLAYSPEREDPGNQSHRLGTIPKIVGGDGPEALALARALYDTIVAKTVPVSSLDVAEAAKLTENIFRSVNIALVNELKIIFDGMGIDVWEVIDAAKTKPFGFMPFYPGPGLGGHCIPIDPFYLSWRAQQFGMDARFIELAGEINTAMPARVVDCLERALTRRFGTPMKGAKILLIGLAYKKNVDDTRESPALRLIEILESRGATVAYHDPHVPEIPPTREHAALAGRKSVDLTEKAVSGFDATLICTDHDAVDYLALVRASKLVIDTRNVTANVDVGQEKIVKA